jgi:hypothetical protein
VGFRAGLYTEARGKTPCLCRGSNPRRSVPILAIGLHYLIASSPHYISHCIKLIYFLLNCLIGHSDYLSRLSAMSYVVHP